MYAVAVGGGTIYIGGVFSLVGGHVARRARRRCVQAERSSLEPEPESGSVFSLAVTGAPAAVYVGGGFTHIGGQTRPVLAAINSITGLADPDLEPGVRRLHDRPRAPSSAR